jgi:hypothetical protein
VIESNAKHTLPSLLAVLYLYQSKRQLRVHVAVSRRETRRTSAIPLREDRDREKSNFPSYLRKKEEVCRLKSVLKNHAKSEAGMKEGERGLERGIEVERKKCQNLHF